MAKQQQKQQALSTRKAIKAELGWTDRMINLYAEPFEIVVKHGVWDISVYPIEALRDLETTNESLAHDLKRLKRLREKRIEREAPLRKAIQKLGMGEDLKIARKEYDYFCKKYRSYVRLIPFSWIIQLLEEEEYRLVLSISSFEIFEEELMNSLGFPENQSKNGRGVYVFDNWGELKTAVERFALEMQHQKELAKSR